MEHILIAIFFLIILPIGIYLPYHKRKGPIVECNAIVKLKRVEPSNTPAIFYRGERINYVITFIDENEKEINLFTIPAIYSELNEGDMGKLKYQRDSIIQFEIL